MRCNEIMKTAIEYIRPSDTVQTAARRMRDEDIGFLPVCDDSGHVIGTVTDRDLVIRAMSDARPPSTEIRDVMTREVVACRPDDEIHVAQQLMAGHHKSRIVCTEEDGTIAGVISLSDIATHVDGSYPAETLREVSRREIRP